MTSIARVFVSIPARSASDTWAAIVSLIAPDIKSGSRLELADVAGCACSCIADEALANDPIVVYGVGPRLRIYALYGDDAVDQESSNESSLSWVPTNGDWHMSIPCLPDDISWLQSTLANSSARVTVRAIGATVQEGDGAHGNVTDDLAKSAGAITPSVDLDAFFRR